MKSNQNPDRPTVLLIGNIPPPYGGVPAHIASVAPYLVENGWNVIVLSSGNPKGITYRDGVKIYKPRTRDNILALLRLRLRFIDILKYWWLLKISPRRFLGILLFANRISSIVQDEKVDLISAYHIYAGLAALPAVKNHNTPMVTTIFGEIFSEFDFYSQIQHKVKELFDRSCTLLSCSWHCAESARLINLDHQVDALYYGIDAQRFKPENDKEFMRKENQWRPTDNVVIFVGRMNYSMGLDVLLDAIPNVLRKEPDTRFLICGAKSTLTERALEVQKTHPNNVKVLVNVDPELLPKCYATANLAVAPSINSRACLGLAILEAMATELPVIACAVGGTGEVVVDGTTGRLITPNDSEALANSISEILNSPDKGKQMGKLGRARVLENFDIHMMNTKSHEIFSALLYQ